jgi:hypothetical protein
MTTFTARGKQLLVDVNALETAITRNGTNKSIGKKVESLELRLSTIRGDFERQAKNLVSKISANKRSNQNLVNAGNRVKKVKVSEMNSEISKMRKLTNGSAPVSTTSVGSSSSVRNKLLNKLTQLNERVTKMDSVIG